MPFSYSWNDLTKCLEEVFPKRKPLDVMNALNPLRYTFSSASRTYGISYNYPSPWDREPVEYDWIFDAMKDLAALSPSRAQATVLNEFYRYGRPALQTEVERVLLDKAFKDPFVKRELKTIYQSILLDSGQNVKKKISKNEADELMEIVIASGDNVEDEVALNRLFSQSKEPSLQIIGRGSLIREAFDGNNDIRTQLSRQAVNKLEWPEDSFVGTTSFGVLRDILKDVDLPYHDAATSWKACTTDEASQSLEDDCQFFLDTFHRLRPSNKRVKRDRNREENYSAFLLTDTDILIPLLRMTQLPAKHVSAAAWKSISLFEMDIASDVSQQEYLVQAALDTKPSNYSAALGMLGKIFKRQERRAIYTIEGLVDEPLSGDLNKDYYVNCLIGKLAAGIAPHTLSNETLKRFSTRVLQVAGKAIPVLGNKHVRMVRPLVHVAEAMIAEGDKKRDSMTEQKPTADNQYQAAACYIDKTLSIITQYEPSASDKYIDTRIAVIHDLSGLCKKLPKPLADTLASTGVVKKWLSACTESIVAGYPSQARRQSKRDSNPCGR